MQIVPIPQADVTVRDATMADVAFIDSLQKIHRDRVGFMATAWIEGKIAKREIIVAEEVGSSELVVGSGDGSSLPTTNSQLPTPLGYCMGVDRYNSHDDVGIIHQLNVVPGKQRGFVGATLLRAMFE